MLKNDPSSESDGNHGNVEDALPWLRDAASSKVIHHFPFFFFDILSSFFILGWHHTKIDLKYRVFGEWMLCNGAVVLADAIGFLNVLCFVNAKF